jgi:hypothetical protein
MIGDIISYKYLLRNERNVIRANAYYIIMKSCIYRLMVPYCAKFLYYEYTHNFYYNNIVHQNSKKIVGRGEKKTED